MKDSVNVDESDAWCVVRFAPPKLRISNKTKRTCQKGYYRYVPMKIALGHRHLNSQQSQPCSPQIHRACICHGVAP